jgi:hypothetical protein
MVMMKNGKPIVPGPNDKRNRDIQQELPKGYAKEKLPKEMKTQSEKIKFKDGESNQYRNTTEGVERGTDCSYDENSMNGK